MDNYREISDLTIRVSLASITKPEKVDQFTKEEDKPKDTFYLMHVLCLLFGLLNMLPLTFFVTANDYWMYKFRDTAVDKVDLNNKTTLQTYFVSGTTVVQTVPSIVFMVLSAAVGHRFQVKSRIILTLALKIVVFAVFTVFIKINTDTFQVTFFALSLLGLALLTGLLNLFQVSSLAVVPKFPPIYMKTFLFGQGMAAIFSSTLQIISLALGTSTETSALFYFLSGTVVIFVSLILFLICQRSDFYQYYMHRELGEVRKSHSKEEIKRALVQIWPVVAIFFIIFLTMALTHPCVTSLVVSQNYGNDNLWNDLYFVPAITFLFGELCSQTGRLLSGPIMTKSNGPWLVGLTVVRMVILVPLVMLCNAQPRSNLPVVFSYDWEYILILLVYFFSSGFIINGIMLSIPRLASGNEDVAYMVLITSIGVNAGLLSPLSLVAVRIL